MPSSRPPGKGSRSPTSAQPPEILHQIGRAVLSYSLKKLNEGKEQSRPRDKSSRQHSSRSKTRGSSSRGERATSRGDIPRSDGNDMHALLSQLAVGACAFGIRHIVRKRREAKQRQAAEKASTTRNESGEGQSQAQGLRAVDPELSAALDAVSREAKGASESIRRLADTAPSHRSCDVRDALVTDAEKLEGSLANLQTSIHNMKNLHPGLQRTSRQDRSARRSPREKTRETPPQEYRVRTPRTEDTPSRRGVSETEEAMRRERHHSHRVRSRSRGRRVEPSGHRSRPGKREEERRRDHRLDALGR